MLTVRSVLAVALIAMGVLIIVRMFPYALATAFTGFVIGGAMIALGVIRLRQISAIRRTRG